MEQDERAQQDHSQKISQNQVPKNVRASDVLFQLKLKAHGSVIVTLVSLSVTQTGEELSLRRASFKILSVVKAKADSAERISLDTINLAQY